jgi:hypothetical protein
MKRFAIVSCLALSVALLALAAGCEWNVPNEDTEKEQEADCVQNPGKPGYDCGDACCNWDQCGPAGLPLYDEYGTCVARCDEALHIFIIDDPSYSEQYKNCVLDCFSACGTRNECLDECAVYANE